jgi:hypothetical protein
MSISPFKTFIAGEVLLASDLNSSFTQITNNALSLISPLTGILDADGKEIVLDGDADSSITADTDDRLDVKLGGVDLFIFDGTVMSPVNGLTFVGSATTTAVEIQAHGSDTDISINLVPKGAGAFQVGGVAVVSAGNFNDPSNIIGNRFFM